MAGGYLWCVAAQALTAAVLNLTTDIRIRIGESPSACVEIMYSAQAGRKYMAHTAAKWWHEQMVYFGYDPDSSKSTWKMQRK